LDGAVLAVKVDVDVEASRFHAGGCAIIHSRDARRFTVVRRPIFVCFFCSLAVESEQDVKNKLSFFFGGGPG